MIQQLLASLPKAAAIALGTVAIAGGAVGAAASAGSGEVPGPVNAVFSALGFGLERELDGDSATATPGAKHKKQAARATATGTALPGRDLPSKSSIPGLCRAYEGGSERGRERKLEATAFKRLQNAADAAGAEDLDDYCEDVLASRRAAPATTGTAAAGTTQGAELERSKGRSENAGDARGKSQEHRPAYSPAATITNSGPARAPGTNGKSEAPTNDARSNGDGSNPNSSSTNPKGNSGSRR